ncbi:unnamed protein product [Diatraea saccharalis]|uniref:Peptidase S1 domain-containing protein n=1 Tax=Diatraea saccharalis TaxID=40085 RepID=A0A9N9R4Q5_9NEOP|nr:unnamed protein product [Diatraea saccharalis]
MICVEYLRCTVLIVLTMNICAQKTKSDTMLNAKNVNGPLQNIQKTQSIKQETSLNSNDKNIMELNAYNSVTLLPNRSVCGLLSDEERIFGGESTDIDEFPWLARIKYVLDSGKEVYACAGSLITQNYVLTAAHCVVNLTIKEVRLGDWNTETETDCQGRVCSDPAVDVSVSQVKIFPEYRKSDTFKGDVALLRLQKPIYYSDFVRPICLPITDDTIRQDNSSKSIYWTAGWGKTENENKANIKQKLAISAVPIGDCRNKQPIITDKTAPFVICAGGVAGKDTCVGDSGGSLVKQMTINKTTNWFLVGVTSYGYRFCGSEGRPGLYARITPLLHWILNNIED